MTRIRPRTKMAVKSRSTDKFKGFLDIFGMNRIEIRNLLARHNAMPIKDRFGMINYLTSDFHDGYK